MTQPINDRYQIPTTFSPVRLTTFKSLWSFTARSLCTMGFFPRHQSVQKEIILPLPTLYLVALCNKALVCIMLLHHEKRIFFSWNSVLGSIEPKYFFLITSIHNSFFSEITFHPSLARIARLLCLAFLTPKPPCFLVSQTTSHLIKWTFFSLSLSPHNKFMFIWRRDLRIKTSKASIYILYKGGLKATCFTRVS